MMESVKNWMLKWNKDAKKQFQVIQRNVLFVKMDIIEWIQCEPCIDDCKKCYNSYQCVVCENSYFIDDELKCISYNELNNCTSKHQQDVLNVKKDFSLKISTVLNVQIERIIVINVITMESAVDVKKIIY